MLINRDKNSLLNIGHKFKAFDTSEIAVLGGTGFIGQWVLQALEEYRNNLGINTNVTVYTRNSKRAHQLLINEMNLSLIIKELDFTNQPILIDKADQELTSTFLRFMSIGASKLMIVKSIQALNSDENRWTKTLSSNLIFIDMVTQEVPFIIHNADLLLEVKTTQDGQKLTEVLFVQGTSIVLMEWGSPAPKELTTRKMLETNIVTQ
jgi:hypothetical protein